MNEKSRYLKDKIKSVAAFTESLAFTTITEQIEKAKGETLVALQDLKATRTIEDVRVMQGAILAYDLVLEILGKPDDDGFGSRAALAVLQQELQEVEALEKRQERIEAGDIDDDGFIPEDDEVPEEQRGF